MDNQLIVSRTFDAPREMVWKAWTDPEMIKQWWGPEGFTSPDAKVDLTIGGKYIYTMHGPAGSEWDKDMYSAGVFKEIVPNEKLVVTDYFSDAEGNKVMPADYGQDANSPDEMTATILFEEVEEGKTKLSVIYDKPATEEQLQAMIRSGMNEGWKSTLVKLGAILER